MVSTKFFRLSGMEGSLSKSLKLFMKLKLWYRVKKAIDLKNNKEVAIKILKLD